LKTELGFQISGILKVMDVKKGYHCAYRIHYHLVLPVKYRKALLVEKIVKSIKEIALAIQERYALKIEQIGCDIDHIHLLCSSHPKYSPGKLVRLFKSITARELFKQFPSLKKELWGGEFWTDGYFIATVGEEVNWSVVEEYIRKQGKTPEQIQLRLI
jgi:putative transposase